MSRGFVREDDQEEAPFIPPRAALPDGATNYVTPRGLELLHAERTALEDERTNTVGSDDERRRTHAVINGKLDLLNERIVTARVVEPSGDAPEDVRFGTTVVYEHLDGPQKGTRRTFTIVGVDEADVKEARIMFTAPIARALIGKRVGGTAEFHLPPNLLHLLIHDIR
jgi:transcription elongation factor GreB